MNKHKIHLVDKIRLGALEVLEAKEETHSEDNKVVVHLANKVAKLVDLETYLKSLKRCLEVKEVKEADKNVVEVVEEKKFKAKKDQILPST